MQHAFAWIPQSRRKGVFVWVALATVAYAVALNRQGAPLKVPVAPAGIVSYELAGTAERAAAILAVWEPQRPVVTRQLEYDFAYLLLYPLAFSLACALLADAPTSVAPRIGRLISWLVLFAAPLDAAENTLLLRMLATGATTTLAAGAALAARLKFAVLLAAAGYLIGQGLCTLFSVARRQRTE